MNEWLDRMYHRYRLRYQAGLAVCLAALFVAVLLGCLWFLIHYEGASAERYWQIVGVTFIALAVGATWSSIIAFRGEQLLVAWLQDGPTPENATEAWLLAVSYPQRVVVTFLVRTVPFALAAVVGMASVTVDGSPIGIVVEAVGVLFASLYLAVVSRLLITVANGPLLKEISGYLPPQLSAQFSGRVGRTLLVELVATSFIVGTVAAAVTSDQGAGAARLLLTFLAAAGAALTFGFLLTGLLTARILDPIRALIQGSEQVATGDLTARVPLLSNDEHGRLAASFNAMVGGLRQREALQSAMGSYVDPVIAQRVLTEGARLSGEAADVTIMFVDIVGFTALAEDAIPEEVVSDLNDFFDLVVPVIERHGGHANKLLGDGLLAVFGVPVPLPDHADHALAAAQEIDQALAERYEGKLRAGIGLNSGTVVVGSMGGGRKLDYTVIGDPVNVAARVEALTRQTGDSILLTEATRQALSDPLVQLEERGSTPVKGRKQQVALYALPNGRSSNRNANPLGSIGQ